MSDKTILSNEYIAGFFDGEGSVYVDQTKPTTFVLKIVIAQNTREVLELIKLQYGGNVYEHNPTNTRSKPSFQWICSSHEAFAFLCNILPFLIVKKEQALLAIQFPLRLAGQNSKPSEEFTSRRKEIRLKLQEMKR